MYQIKFKKSPDGSLGVYGGRPFLLERLDAQGFERVFGGERVPRPVNLTAKVPEGFRFWRDKSGEVSAIADSGEVTNATRRD